MPLSIYRTKVHCVLVAAAMFAMTVTERLEAQTTQPATRATTRAASRRGPQTPSLGDLMDYGPFLSYSVLRPGLGNAATQPAAQSATATGRHAAVTDGGELLA